ncbi:MAG TPA: patatin-like phospholipase family protein [Anaerolineales bacterium]|nr:patatin-like phospholipase family protein [Anaerolineales bacterium]HNN12857.1 patatin-like phospholipase family protein [Anaerolineales bacterium]HNO30253.1 patatin-like phospholipase family protein [Anaerolineales bacterium]
MEISLALGGGGAKGNAHIGVLRRLEREGFKIRSVAGTSYGGLVGIFYAVGYSPDQIQALFESVDQNNLYGRAPQDGPSLLGLAGVRQLLEKELGDKTFKDLRIPCAVTAVDINSGTEILLSEGKLLDAVLATIALPGIFPVQRINGWDLVDGGVLNPVPVSVARGLSPDLPVVAVVLNDPMEKPIRPYTIPVPSILPRPIADRINRISLAQSLDVFLRSVDASSRAMAYFRLELDKPEVIIHPNVHDINLLDQVVVANVAQLGEQAVEEVLPQLKRAVSWTARVSKVFLGMRS